MKYFISDNYGCVYWLEGGVLNWTPQRADNTFDTDEGGAVERPHDEVPESYFEQVMRALAVNENEHGEWVCPKYNNASALPNEQDNCSLCGAVMVAGYPEQEGND